jgi:alpha-beta hydrolase superfamily lysophospholipase
VHEAEVAAMSVRDLPTDLSALPAYLEQQERHFPDIVPGTEKHIRFGSAGAQRANWAVVYLHGFSATRQETSPLSELVAEGLGANFFATRFAGHGRGSAPLAEASLDAWKADVLQALAIGRRLGERVLVIGVSTGAALATWLAQQPDAQEDVAWILISPNFGPRDKASEIIKWRWGRTLAHWVTGPEYSFEPRSPDQARYWTTRYPTRALFPMMAAVHLARQQPLEAWRAPVLMLLSPRDQVVDIFAARRAFKRIGAPQKRLVEVTNSSDVMQHVIAGRILSPANTAGMAQGIVEWVGILQTARCWHRSASV